MSTNPLPSPVPGQTLVAGPPFPRPHRFLELSELQRCQLVRVDAVSSAPSMLRGTRIRCWYGGWDFASESRSPVFPEEQGDFQHWLMLDKGKQRAEHWREL